jgi:hypothetical protein
MSDLMAILAVGLQHWLIILTIGWYRGRALPLSISVAIFSILVAVGLALWHRTGSSQTAKTMAKVDHAFSRSRRCVLRN